MIALLALLLLPDSPEMPECPFSEAVAVCRVRTVVEYAGLIPVWSPDHRPWVVDVREIKVYRRSERIGLEDLRSLNLSRPSLDIRVTYRWPPYRVGRRTYEEVRAVSVSVVD